MMGHDSKASGKKSTRTHGSEPQLFKDDSPYLFLDLPPELRNRIYGFILTHTPCHGGLCKLSVRPSLRSVIRNSNKWEGDNRNILAILQTSRQVYNEARDLPYSYNFIRFGYFEYLGEFVGHASERQLSAIQHIEVVFELLRYDAHNWGMLRFFPKLSSLRPIDADFRSHAFLADPQQPVAVKVSALRGLNELEVMLPHMYGLEIDEEWKRNEANAKRLEAAWKALITQPKRSAE